MLNIAFRFLEVRGMTSSLPRGSVQQNHFTKYAQPFVRDPQPRYFISVIPTKARVYEHRVESVCNGLPQQKYAAAGQ